jgi:acyl-CoA thioester hydrolase
MLRVRYAETDRMGAVNSARYFEWFELGRSDLLREKGLSYDAIERSGVFMPVVEAECRYLARLGYDDLIRVETTVEAMSAARVRFAFRVYRAAGDGSETLAAEGRTDLAAVNREGRPTRLPREVVEALGVSRS